MWLRWTYLDNRGQHSCVSSLELLQETSTECHGLQGPSLYPLVTEPCCTRRLVNAGVQGGHHSRSPASVASHWQQVSTFTSAAPAGCLPLCSQPRSTQTTSQELLALRFCRGGHHNNGKCMALGSSQWRSLSSLPKAGPFFADRSLSFLLPHPCREMLQPLRKCPSPCSTTAIHPENSLLPTVSSAPQGTCVEIRMRAR